MKITINGSPKELVELLDALGGMENAEENHELPPLLTELAEDEKINELGETIWNADKENAPQAESAEQKIKDFANALQGCLAQASLKN